MDYFSRLNKTNTKDVSKRDLNLAQFFRLNHFRAGLPTELHRVLNLQNQDELSLSNDVKLATINARSKGRPNVPARCMLPQHLTITKMLKLTSSSKIPCTTDRHQGGSRHSCLTKMVSSHSHPSHPGDQPVKATPLTGMDKPAFSVRCRTTVRRSAANGSRLTSHAWTPMATHSGRKSMRLTPTHQLWCRL